MHSLPNKSVMLADDTNLFVLFKCKLFVGPAAAVFLFG